MIVVSNNKMLIKDVNWIKCVTNHNNSQLPTISHSTKANNKYITTVYRCMVL